MGKILNVSLCLGATLLISCSSLQPISNPETASYPVPSWAEGVVWYQIFPERFSDGDQNNQPSRQRAEGPEDWHVTSWTQDWYKMDEWEKKRDKDFYGNVTTRRYGGDLQGVIDKLDYLKNLGVGAIYFNPVFDAQSMHKYDASYYHHIDRNFGPDPAGDVRLMQSETPGDPKTWKWTSADLLFLKLIEEAHSRGIKVVIDGVWNHTGTQFWAFKDVEKNQEQSLYKDWYVVKTFDNPATPNTNEFDYEGWWGHKALPVFREENGTLMPPTREHIFAATRRWMDPNGDGNPADGIDGWRLDVAEEIGKNWWKEWHALVRMLNPQALTVAEIWTEKAREFITEDMFSSVMNYRFAYAAKDFLIDDRISTDEFTQRLEEVERDYPSWAGHVLQNLIDSHDTPRLASIIVNPGREYDRQGHPKEGFDIRKPNQAERQIQKLVALFQFTWKGAPMIYYGTEAGMWGPDDPDDRKPMVWDDLEYEPETHHPFQKERQPDSNDFDKDLHAFYRKLAQIRNSEPALQTGSAEIVYHDPEKKVVVFKRAYKGETIYVLLNRSNTTQKVDMTAWAGSNQLHDLISNNSLEPTNIQVAAVSGLILK